MTNKVYQIVADRMITLMDNGTAPWRKPWAKIPVNFYNISGRKYNGINWFFLAMLQYETPVFLTFNQAVKLGGSVKKGAKAIPIFFYTIFEEKKDGQIVRRPVFRYSTAFNIEDCENVKVPKKITDALTVKLSDDTSPIESAESIVTNMPNKPGIKVALQNAACYSPVSDSIMVPKIEQFIDNKTAYYATLFHELGHSTGHASRLNRAEVMNFNGFGSHEYSREELVAEFCSAFLCAEAGISNELSEANSAAYLASWKRVIAADPAMVVQAATKAQKAADYILNRNSAEGVDVTE